MRGTLKPLCDYLLPPWPSPSLRKSHQRALESVQASLDVEVKGKAEGLKLKKKLEADINELELQVDLLTKSNAELGKNSKKMQQQIKVCSEHPNSMWFPTAVLCNIAHGVSVLFCPGAAGSAGGGGQEPRGAQGGAGSSGTSLRSVGQ